MLIINLFIYLFFIKKTNNFFSQMICIVNAEDVGGVCITAGASSTQQLCSSTGSRTAGRGNEMWTGSIKVMMVGRATVAYGLGFFLFFCGLYLWPRHFFLTLTNRMETLLFLFPQFNYMAQKEEAYFKMLVPEDSQAAKMKDDSSGWVDSHLIWSLLNCAPAAFARFSSA